MRKAKFLSNSLLTVGYVWTLNSNQESNLFYGKPDGTPKSWSIYSIVSILTEPGCDHDRST